MSLRRATAVMTAGTVLSRATGLIRLGAIAAALGVTQDRLADTYNLANTAPNIIYELILGGVLTSVFVPVFVELLEKEGAEKAWRVASAIINLTVIGLTAIAALGIVCAPWLATFYSSRLSGPEAALQHRTLTFLLQLFLPQIIFYGLAAVTSGLLNAHKRFAAPMYTPVLNNLAVTTVFLTYAFVYGGTPFARIGTPQILLMGLGTTLGVVLMAVAQIPFLRGLGNFTFALSLKHPSVKRLARLSTYVIAYVITNQVGYLTVQYLANKQTGGFTAYTYAFMFFQLPHGLFAVSIITALLPGMSAEAVRERWDNYRSQLSIGIRTTFMLILPAAVGYIVLAEPIVRLLLKHGVTTEASTDLVARVLQVFAVGLVPFSIFQLLLRAFYALRDTKTPFFINCVSTAVNIAINFAFFAAFEVQGLAAGYALSYFVASGGAMFYLSRRIGGVDGARILASLVRILVAAAGMGAVVWFVAGSMGAFDSSGGVLANLFQVIVPVTAGVIAYAGFAFLVRVPELELVTGILKRRLGRGGTQQPPGNSR